jgi:hypothetical protein
MGIVAQSGRMAMYYQPSPLSTFYSELSDYSTAGGINLRELTRPATDSDTFILI